MAMSFGPWYDNRRIPKGTPKPNTNPIPEISMATNVENAAKKTISYLTSTYESHSKSFDNTQLGITPMIGNNIYQAYTQYSSNSYDWNIFTLNDQKQVIKYANKNNVGMLSMWSWSRDNPGTGLPAKLSPSNSGIKQNVGEFSKNFDAYYKANDMITNPGNSADPSWLYSFGSSDVQAKMTDKGHTNFSFDADECSIITGFTDRPNRLTEEIIMKKFAKNFNKMFGKDKPNASLTHWDGGEFQNHVYKINNIHKRKGQYIIKTDLLHDDYLDTISASGFVGCTAKGCNEPPNIQQANFFIDPSFLYSGGDG